MKYQIGQKVIANNNKCIIIATKYIPYKPNNDVSNKKEIYPQNDYLLAIFKKVEKNMENYSGYLDVYENEIEENNW